MTDSLSSRISLLPKNAEFFWPLTRRLCEHFDGRLVGGTALTIHLGHRQSEDFDICTTRRFSGVDFARRMRPILEDLYGAGHGVKIMLQWADDGGYSVRLNNVKFDVFRVLETSNRGSNETRWLEARPQTVDGVPVAGVPDILAMKLETITLRRQLRDYVDISSIDRMTSYSLEVGLEMFKRKYRYDEYPSPPAVRRVVAALGRHGDLGVDAICERDREAALFHLRRRIPDVMAYLEKAGDIA